MVTSSPSVKPPPVRVTVPPCSTGFGVAVSVAAAASANADADPSCTFTAASPSSGSRVTLSARTVNPSAPRSLSSGCSLMVTASTSVSTGSSASSSSPVTIGCRSSTSDGWMSATVVVSTGRIAAPMLDTTGVIAFTTGCSTAPRSTEIGRPGSSVTSDVSMPSGS